MRPETATALEKMAPTTKTRTRVPIISLIRFAPNYESLALCRNMPVSNLGPESPSNVESAEAQMIAELKQVEPRQAIEDAAREVGVSNSVVARSSVLSKRRCS